MPTFKITLAYDGAGLVGWQRQAAGTSVQGLLEDVLHDLDGCPVTVIGAGRTDAGVHALGQVASFTLDRPIAPDTLLRALNARLPGSVRVVAAAAAPATFHARFDARTKTYRYRIWHGDVINPFERQYVWHLPVNLEVDRMAEAARKIEGRHDFAAFQAAGGAARTSERDVFSSWIGVHEGEEGQPDRASPVDGVGPAPGAGPAIGAGPAGGAVPADGAGPAGGARPARQPGRLIVYEICGTGFLRHMVRNIVGTLVEIGRGRRAPESIGEVIGSRDRTRAGPTAPAAGLFLVNMTYETENVPDDTARLRLSPKTL